MGTYRASLVPLDAEAAKEMQLRVAPSEVKFQDTLAGKVYRLPVTIHNLGHSNQKIRFLQPVKTQFKLILSSLEKELASGLQLTAMVEYRPDKDEETFDELLFLIGKKAIRIPLIGLIPSCQLEIESEVNFGTLVSNYKIYSKEISVFNHGKVPGMFTADYQGQLPIFIFPTNGIVQPNSSIIVKVDFCAEEPRIVNEVAKISLQGRPDVLLNIKVHVVEQILELLNMSDGKKVEFINFGPTFFGTSKIERVHLYNNSPEPINWVAIMQNDSVGEELGTDIYQRTDVVINNLTYVRKVKDLDITTFISCVPNEGSLQPYRKTTITFCFSPKLITDNENNNDPSHRQDYAIFLRFDSVGSKDGFLRDDDSKTLTNDRFQKVELALTGSGLPVVLQFDPGRVLNFEPCFKGEQSEIICTICNQSKSLPVMWQFKRTAHLQFYPESETIGVGHTQDFKCTFTPYKAGVFKRKHFIDIVGPVADEKFKSVSLKTFHKILFVFNCVCKRSTEKVMKKIHHGISPLISNPVDQFMVKNWEKSKEYAPVAMLQSTVTSIHNHRSSKESAKDTLIAFPNDRAASIKSGERNKHFRTIFTNIPRYNYVDPEFAYTDSEKLEKKAHEDYYAKYIKYVRNVEKKKSREDNCTCDDTDIGLCSCLKSPSLSESDIGEDASSECEIKPYQLLSTRDIECKEAYALERKVLKGLKSEPYTPNEKHDCSLVLTPRQIHQVIVGPAILNFGDICVKSTNTRVLHVVNMLHIYILIQLEVNLKELQKTNQFSYVIPPSSSTNISVIFESPTAGKFWKSFTFTVNNIPGGHILVMAVVTPVKLELSSSELQLRSHNFLLKTCFRETLRLYNHQNYFVHFEWHPVNTSKGIGFFIHPTKGTVEPYCSLYCEVTWKPGFSSPERGEFILHIDDGNTLTLKCVAHLGPTKVLFLEPKIVFSNSPQGLTACKKIILHNVGQNHAYFKVCDQSLLSIINIIPLEGIIPFGGITILNIFCTSSVVEEFDTRAKVAIRHAHDIDLMIGGTVAIAEVEIIPHRFVFSGTYVGTTTVVPFLIKNKGVTRARVEFNLEGCECFSMEFKDKLVQITDPAFPDIYYFEVDEKTSLKCGIAFSPKDVATYEYTVQVRINSFNASELYTQKHLSKSTTPSTPLIRPCFIQATVLQVPLRLSNTEFIFEIPSHVMNLNTKVTRTQDLVLYNILTKEVPWVLDISKSVKLFKDGIFKISELSGVLQPEKDCTVSITFCPTHSRKYTASIPLRLNNNPVCYQVLHLIGEVKSPKLLFDPPVIFFTPVPLNITAVMNIRILPRSYFRHATLNVKIPRTRLRDGNEIHTLSANFPKGKAITGSPKGMNAELCCHLSFRSSHPVSFSTNVLFGDNRDNWFLLPVTATAENCILTIYPYIAVYLDKEDIIIRSEKDDSLVKTRENILLPSPEARLPSSSPSKCHDANPAKRFFVGTGILPEKLNLGKSEMSKKEDIRWIEKEVKNEQYFPEEGTKAYDFFQKVVNAAETWFTLFGWPEGPHYFSIPETIRRDVYKMQVTSSPKRISRRNDILRYNKTIYDVIHHFSGKLPDGIYSSQSLPSDYTERVIQLYIQHRSLLDFLSSQGAYMSHVLPEFLFDPEDYMKWIKLTSSGNILPVCYYKEKNSVFIDKSKFDAYSKRAWTDVFLQIYKVLVLSRVVPHPKSKMPHTYVLHSPKVNPCLVSSNMYSDYERILLSWMNTNYENTRRIIWEKSQKGTGVIPSERWIVNFDSDLSDGLVLATQLGAYCPFLIESHFVNMYTEPISYEQHFHNALIIVNALHEIRYNVGIQASDICDPNPILLLMLCVYMHERLPSYLPKKVLTFQCTLHDTVMKLIILRNPSLKNLQYDATIIGRDAADFSLSEIGNTVTISPKSEIPVTVKFTSHFLRPAEALLLFIPKSISAAEGASMTFTLKGKVHNFKPIEIIKCTVPCYQWKSFTVKVQNSFHTAGDFNVILVESSSFISLTSRLIATGQFISSRRHGDPGNSDEPDIDNGSSSLPDALKTSIKSNFIREFFCTSHTLHLGVKRTSDLKLLFLPFDMQTRYCVIILSNKQIGELIYIAEGKGTLPFPSSLHPVNYSSSHDFGIIFPCGSDMEKPIMYLKCKPFQTLDVDLILPLTNEAKEKAFAFAAQQQMSEKEYQRRLLTGTLESSSVRVAIALLGLTRTETFMLFNFAKFKKPKSILYITELSLPNYFQIPEKIYVPHNPEMQAKRLNPMKKTVPDGCFSIPLKFCPDDSGSYPCKILLMSRYDVRIFYVEGVVSEELPEAAFKFDTPAFEALSQKIPISNKTSNEWKFHITIEGEYFSGPSLLYVGPFKTVQYLLTFKPFLECEIKGKLTLRNEINGVEHIIEIKGIGRKPVAFEHIIINSKVGIRENKTIMVPNYARELIIFKVSSDLPMVWGNPHIAIGPLDVVPYNLHICSQKHGVFKGKLSFSTKSTEDGNCYKYLDQVQNQDQDQDGEHILPVIRKSVSELSSELYEEDSDDSKLILWFSLELHISPGEPENIIEITCTSMERSFFEIPLYNPKEEILHLKVQFSNPALSGLMEFVLHPQGSVDYEACCTPASTGCRDESIVFHPDKAPEFWYLVKITVELPNLTAMQEIQCDLGKYITQFMYLVNPTHETLQLQATNSNPDHFVLDVNESQLTIPPYITKELPVHFHPSALGRTGHQASIVFHCAQFEEWKFLLSGVGLYPQPLEIEKTTTYVGLEESVTITFQNPTKENVLINIVLTNREKPKNFTLGIHCDSFLVETSTFKLNLEQEQEILLPPKGSINIPVLYQPKAMRLQKTMVVVQMMRANGKSWPVDNFDELGPAMKRTMGIDTGEIQTIQWIYPIIGLPKGTPIDYPQVLLKCQAKKQVGRHLTITLAGDFLGENPIMNVSSFLVCPRRHSYSSYEDINVVPIKHEFEYEILFESEEMKSKLQYCLTLLLMEKSYDKKAQRITLAFNLMFSPRKPLRTQVTLQVECITDGTWDFPITLVATEPDVNSVINIRAAGLYKEAFVELPLTNSKRLPEPFTAHFQPGSAPEFFVKPQSGEIPPHTDGTHITVGFIPRILSRKYKAKLIVQTEDTYNIYIVNGLPELIKPPMNVKARIDSTNKVFDSRLVLHHNFVHENIKHIRTGLSSTIKSPSLMLKNK